MVVFAVSDLMAGNGLFFGSIIGLFATFLYYSKFKRQGLTVRQRLYHIIKSMAVGFVFFLIVFFVFAFSGSSNTMRIQFDDTTKMLVHKANQSRGVTFPSSGEVSFHQGEAYPADIFKTASGGKQVSYTSTMCSGTGSVCTISGTVLTINSNFKSTISVCCSATECKIGIGETVTC